MGCANVFQKKLVQSKDIDLNLDVIKPCFKDTNDTSYFKNKELKGICDEKAIVVKNAQELIIESKDNNEEKVINQQNKKNSIGSGPIINMLKRQYYSNKKLDIK